MVHGEIIHSAQKKGHIEGAPTHNHDISPSRKNVKDGAPLTTL
jgi:hypothetical protein